MAVKNLNDWQKLPNIASFVDAFALYEINVELTKSFKSFCLLT